MENEKKFEIYYVYDIGRGVLISNGAGECSLEKSLPNKPIITFACYRACDALGVANYILDKERGGASITDGDYVIDVCGSFYSDERFYDNCESKAE